MKILFLFILIVVLTSGTYFYIRYRQKDMLPPPVSFQEIEDAKKLPKDKCGCWDERNNICRPQSTCY